MKVVILDSGFYQKADGKKTFVTCGTTGTLLKGSVYGRRVVAISGGRQILVSEDNYVQRTSVTVQR